LRLNVEAADPDFGKARQDELLAIIREGRMPDEQGVADGR
jgi:hypothetical protein